MYKWSVIICDNEDQSLIINDDDDDDDDEWRWLKMMIKDDD